MEKRSKRVGKTTTTASKRAHNSTMEASTQVGKTTRGKSANKTTRARTSTRACK